MHSQQSIVHAVLSEFHMKSNMISLIMASSYRLLQASHKIVITNSPKHRSCRAFKIADHVKRIFVMKNRIVGNPYSNLALFCDCMSFVHRCISASLSNLNVHVTPQLSNTSKACPLNVHATPHFLHLRKQGINAGLYPFW